MPVDQSIFCRGCGLIKPISDKELDAEWERNKKHYPNANVTRAETLNGMSFCSECAGLSDETTLHTIKVK